MTCENSQPSVGVGEHAVQFYRTDDELAAVVGAYLAEGARSGDGVIVVATAPHRRAFGAALAEAGVDVTRERAASRLLVEDAAELLGRFFTGEELDPERFRSALSGLIRRAAAGGRPVRIYGDMVALLCDAGHVTLATELEALWNGLGALLPFALRCGYPCDAMSGDTVDAVREICGLHSAVITTRSFPSGVDSVRAARHFTVGLFDGKSSGELADDAAIVVTELAANAVTHAHSGFTLTVFQSATGVKVAVRDNRPLLPRSDDQPFDIEADHGLSVVGHLAREWAVERLPDGKVVWVELGK